MNYHKPYSKLRGKLREMDLDYRTFAPMISRSTAYVALRMTGKRPWDMDDQYRILDLIEASDDELIDYFPRTITPTSRRNRP